MKRPLLLLFLLICLLVGGYFFWWKNIAWQMEKRSLAWIEDLRLQGYQIEYGQPEFSGFPLRLSMQIQAPLLISPDRKLIYRGTRLELDIHPWNITRYQLNFPGLQKIEIHQSGRKEQLDITAKSLFATIGRAADGRWGRIDLQARNIDLQARVRQQSYQLADFHLSIAPPDAIDRRPEDPESPQFIVQITGKQLRLPKKLNLPFESEIRHISNRFKLYGPLENTSYLRALEIWQAGGGRIDLDALDLLWGDIELRAHGTLALDSDLYPLIDLKSEISGLSDGMMRLAERGEIDMQSARLGAFVLQLLSRRPAKGGAEKISIHLSAQNGALYIGPFKLAHLPSLKTMLMNKRPEHAEPAPLDDVTVMPLSKD